MYYSVLIRFCLLLMMIINKGDKGNRGVEIIVILIVVAAAAASVSLLLLLC